ncbi:hypothetical protein POVWA2_041690 [Plasmodium ovale wallikeri]|uniref:Uncharacterized protein n=1 Tax=Plasmodium ovale wallikeri TaxID=864142 RepID=A0A1A8ZAQ1_PLAOA|nr:hypothetical protein POVWA1_043240 [Plasmodium ovale wallikeri]SBT41371.1 hypothetical protein POVWA2_041690 [Plasmodium ovale wallikeri]
MSNTKVNQISWKKKKLKKYKKKKKKRKGDDKKGDSGKRVYWRHTAILRINSKEKIEIIRHVLTCMLSLIRTRPYVSKSVNLWKMPLQLNTVTAP